MARVRPRGKRPDAVAGAVGVRGRTGSQAANGVHWGGGGGLGGSRPGAQMLRRCNLGGSMVARILRRQGPASAACGCGYVADRFARPSNNLMAVHP